MGYLNLKGFLNLKARKEAKEFCLLRSGVKWIRASPLRNRKEKIISLTRIRNWTPHLLPISEMTIKYKFLLVTLMWTLKGKTNFPTLQEERVKKVFAHDIQLPIRLVIVFVNLKNLKSYTCIMEEICFISPTLPKTTQELESITLKQEKNHHNFRWDCFWTDLTWISGKML